jgi:uncharacterized protein
MFLSLTFGLSAVFWWLIIDAGNVGAHGGRYVFLLMWCPAALTLGSGSDPLKLGLPLATQ